MFLHSLSLTHTHPFPLLLKTHRTPTHPFLSLCSMLSGEGKVYPLQYSGLENSVDCIVRGLANSWTRLSDFRSLTHSILSCKKKNKKTFPILPAPCLCLLIFHLVIIFPRKTSSNCVTFSEHVGCSPFSNSSAWCSRCLTTWPQNHFPTFSPLFPLCFSLILHCLSDWSFIIFFSSYFKLF